MPVRHLVRPGSVPSRLLRPAFAVAIAAGVALSGLSGALAQDATPEGAGGPPAAPPIPESCSVVASGLNSPRHILVADDGSILISEAGIGGDETTDESEVGTSEIGTPAAEESVAGEATAEAATADEAGAEENPFAASSRGYTGQITIVTADGEQAVFGDGFVSYADGVGPAGMTFADGLLYVVVGGTAIVGGRDELDGENSLFAIDPISGTVTQVAAFGANEIAENPDGTDVNSNLYGLGLGPDGLLYVVDAGGNAVYTVDPVTGEAALFYTFPTLDVIMGDDAPPEAADRQVVPTDIAFSVDGNPIVSFLSEGWPAGAPSIVEILPDGTLETLATDLSLVVSIQPGPDGLLYAAELTTDITTFAPGRVVAIDVDDPGAEPVVALDGLFAAHGLAFTDAGDLYVGVGAVAMGPEPMGQVLLCTGVAGAAGDTDAATPVAARPAGLAG